MRSIHESVCRREDNSFRSVNPCSKWCSYSIWCVPSATSAYHNDDVAKRFGQLDNRDRTGGLKKFWPWVRCKHTCSCIGDTYSYGHNSWCQRNPLHPRWHRKGGVRLRCRLGMHKYLYPLLGSVRARCKYCPKTKWECRCEWVAEDIAGLVSDATGFTDKSKCHVHNKSL